MDPIRNDAQLVSEAERVLYEMAKVEEFASFAKNDQAARIPRGTLSNWYEALDNVLFRLRAEIDK